MVHTEHNISYTNDTQNVRNRLDVYYSNKDSLRDVLVFVHGGAWESGNKETYKFLGRNLVRKGLVTVIINYNLSPNQIYRMARDCTAAVVWVKRFISNYGGNPNRIFLMGHSAGGHLIELINSDRRYFSEYNIPNPIYGMILLDAFGLDMYEYLNTPSSKNDKYYATFIQVFSNDPRNWQEASPMRYLRNITNPHLILVGGKTYPTIQTQSRRLFSKLRRSRQAPAELYEIPGRKHAAMISSMFFSSNQQYDIILSFMQRN